MPLSKETIHLRVANASQSAVFYEALLAAAPTERRAHVAIFDLESPPVVITLEERPRRPGLRHPGVKRPDMVTLPSLALVVAEPRQVGDAAIRLRKAGVRLWVQDEGIEARDPDGNAWHVRCVPAAPGWVISTSSEAPRARRR